MSLTFKASLPATPNFVSHTVVVFRGGSRVNSWIEISNKKPAITLSSLLKGESHGEPDKY